MAYERYEQKTEVKGMDTFKRKELLSKKTGKCERCGINLYGGGMPLQSPFPCRISRCPFEKEN